MDVEELEKQFEEIAARSRPLFKAPVEVFKETNPIGTYVRPTTGDRKPLLPLLDPNLELMTKVMRLLFAHDLLKDEIYDYQQEKPTLYIGIIPELEELSDIAEFKNLLDQLNKLLAGVGGKNYIYRHDIEEFNKTRDITERFVIQLNNILQRIHDVSSEVLLEYNTVFKTFKDEKGREHTEVLYIRIGKSTRVINVEPYNLPEDIIKFINAFNDEIEKSDYASYLNVIYIPFDKKYRLDLTLGAAFAHRAVIIYDTDTSQKFFEHTYADTNYSRTLAWKKYIVDFSEEASKATINFIEETRKPDEKSLAWRYTLMKVRVEKEFLQDLAIIIYLINWDGVINHSIRYDIMEVEDEADIIYHYGLYAEYIEKEGRYTTKYDKDTQRAIREAIKDTARGIEKVLLPEK